MTTNISFSADLEGYQSRALRKNFKTMTNNYPNYAMNVSKDKYDDIYTFTLYKDDNELTKYVTAQPPLDIASDDSLSRLISIFNSLRAKAGYAALKKQLAKGKKFNPKNSN